MTDLEITWYCHGCGHSIPNPHPGGPGLGRCTECGDFRWASWPKDTQPVQISVTAPVQPPTSPHFIPATLGKDATCSYCGGALWVCRGVHNVC